MVGTVAVFEAKVRSEDQGVNDEPDGVIEPWIVAKSMMAAFVTDDPQTHKISTLEKPINRPCYIC
ncbi:hypothetical protein HanXRQr2_Chr06g0251481 [Helianthus annuus]|uniref:Uncharacterized protein n=1 Tax=Helianthus annuus TaxID=4232 RepID=A0A9K3IRC6_HELAN|nr:hypothetical protein HanXRQr2_Chr06g0251481 [Helianthus annuus]